jgi:hypothetical protein
MSSREMAGEKNHLAKLISDKLAYTKAYKDIPIEADKQED